MPEGSDESQKAEAARAFISYASADSAIANAVCAALERGGVNCWIAPRDVIPGELYSANIVHAIDTTDVLVLVLSQHSADSAHVLREVERASSRRHPVLSFRIDQAPLPDGLEYFLNTSQWLDASSTGAERSLPRLVDAVKNVLTKPAAATHVNHGPSVTTKTNARSSRLFVALGVAIAVVVAYLVVDKIWLSKRSDTEPASTQATSASPSNSSSAPSISENSIAVLPFSDLSENKDQEYFSDGLSEELIDHLARGTKLKVVARSSSFAFKGKNEDVRTIAAKLGVTNLLQGSVRKAGNRLRITAQLIRAKDGVLLWSETYDRKLDDVFELQDEISTRVATALDAALNMAPGTGESPAGKQTSSTEAYNLMLRGQYFFWRGNKGDEAKAVDFFRQALEKDPEYALAWAKLSRTYVWQGFIGDLSSDEAVARSREAAERALAIDPNCAEAYYARANMYRLLTGEWSSALADYERAYALDPNGKLGMDARNGVLYVKADLSGQIGDVIVFLERRLESDPLDSETLFDLAFAQQNAGQLTESAATFRRLLEMKPDYSAARLDYAYTLLFMGKNTEALAMAEQEPDGADKLVVLTVIYWSLGRRIESDLALKTLERSHADRKAYQIAEAYAYRGEADAAFAWLDRTFRQRKGSLMLLKRDPLLQKLRGDPRYGALLRKANIPE